MLDVQTGVFVLVGCVAQRNDVRVLGGQRPASTRARSELLQITAANQPSVVDRLVGGQVGKQAAVATGGAVAVDDQNAAGGGLPCDHFAGAAVAVGEASIGGRSRGPSWNAVAG